MRWMVFIRMLMEIGRLLVVCTRFCYKSLTKTARLAMPWSVLQIILLGALMVMLMEMSIELLEPFEISGVDYG